jgi:hypothetical protein
MTNSHAPFSIRRNVPTGSVAAQRHLSQRIYQQPLFQTTTSDSSSTIQRPRSAAPSRNASSTSLSTLAKAIHSTQKERENHHLLPDYLEGTSYGVWTSNWREQLTNNPVNNTNTNGNTPVGSISMRREVSASYTVPSSRNPSPHHHSRLASHTNPIFEVPEKSTNPSTEVNEPPPLPSKFNERDRCPVLELLNDGMDAKFAGPSKGGDTDAASVRADHPIPPSCGIYYFEVHILSRGSQGCHLLPYKI